MIMPIPTNKHWKYYIDKRFAEAVELGLFASASHAPKHAEFFALDNFNYGLANDIAPETTALRELSGEPARVGKWITRSDLFEEASSWLIEQSMRRGLNWIVCQAGYQDIGDGILKKRQHIIWNDTPFYCVQIEGITSENLATVLRQGRSWRSLGAAIKWNHEEPYRPSLSGIFFCDIFDGDSLIVASI